jgi:pyridoxal phosphate enzyme (YggS family)
MPDVARNIALVRERIGAAARACGRNPDEIVLLAVSKGQPLAQISAALDAGQSEFGENYLQEALEKMPALGNRGVIWHFIGALQANKTRAVAENFAWVQTVDRERIAQRLSAQRPADLPPLNVCIEVRLSEEPSKHGALPEEVPALAASIASLPRLRLRGLMTIPAPARNPNAQRQPFRQLHILRDRLRAEGHALDTLSMGMSDDLEAAIAEGATMVRIGTAIFGPRTAVSR